MELFEKEVYLAGEAGEAIVSGFVKEVKPLREKHRLKINRGNTAFLIMDMQHFFFDERSHAFIPSASDIIKKIVSIRDRCNELNMPVIYTRHVNTPEDAGQMGKWWRDFITRENNMSEIINELMEPGISIVEKSQYNAFYKTDLERLLRSKNISQLIISGVMTHLCCETTAREAYVRGFDVFFGIDFTATYNRAFHGSTLRNLAHGFALPLTAGEVLERLI
ncbi:MAG: isochorismatase family protein [Acidobacteriota bacterium]